MGGVRELADRLIEIPGVVAVTLGGSRAGGAIDPDSDWGFRLYYQEAIRADDVRALGFEGTVVEPGAWGRFVNGGAWLTVEDQRVDLLYRDLDVVQHWIDEAESGRYEVDQVAATSRAWRPTCWPGSSRWRSCWWASCPDPGFPTRFGRPRPDAGGAAPASRSRSPTLRRRATMWSRARGCSQRQPSRPHRPRSPSAAGGR